MKILSLFSGIGAFEKALTNMGVPYELAAYCEIDKYASRSYAAIHGVSEDKNLGDITKVDEHVLALIRELKPKYWFIENPRGGMRKMTWMQGLPRYTVTYCQYGDNRMKPTDIWTNHPAPRFRPMCKNGDPCHESAPRGSKTGTQGLKGSKERSIIPPALCEHIACICEE